MWVRMEEARPTIQSYRTVHQIEPQTIAYALADSPAGTAALILGAGGTGATTTATCSRCPACRRGSTASWRVSTTPATTGSSSAGSRSCPRTTVIPVRWSSAAARSGSSSRSAGTDVPRRPTCPGPGGGEQHGTERVGYSAQPQGDQPVQVVRRDRRPVGCRAVHRPGQNPRAARRARGKVVITV